MLVVQVFTNPQSLLFIDGQTTFWQRKSIRLHIVCADGAQLKRLADREGITYTVVPFRRPVHLLWDTWCLLVLIRLLRQLRPDIVHTNTPKASLIGLIAAWLASVPTRIYEVHGFVFESRSGLSRAFLIMMEQFMGSLATHLLFVSHSLARVAGSHRIGHAKPGTVPHHGSCNGVDAYNRFNPKRFPQPERLFLKKQIGLTEQVIGFIGRLTTEKGLHTLTAAWQILRTDPSVSLLVVGSADKTAPADLACLRALSNDPRVCLTGFVEDTARYLALMDVLVLPTHREGFGNVLIEAAAMEVPVVASRVTGVIDAVQDRQTGMLVETEAIGLFADAIRTYLADPALRQRHGRTARQRVMRDFVPADVWEAKYRFYAHSVTSPIFSA